MNNTICDCVYTIVKNADTKIRVPNPDCPIHGRNVDPHKTSLTFNPFANLGSKFKASR